MATMIVRNDKVNNGRPTELDYSAKEGSPTTYSPHSGACGGDPAEFDIELVWDCEMEMYIELTDEEIEFAMEHLDTNHEFDYHDWEC
jgi:hypothetical protein